MNVIMRVVVFFEHQKAQRACDRASLDIVLALNRRASSVGAAGPLVGLHLPFCYIGRRLVL